MLHGLIGNFVQRRQGTRHFDAISAKIVRFRQLVAVGVSPLVALSETFGRHRVFAAGGAAVAAVAAAQDAPAAADRPVDDVDDNDDDA